MPAPTERQVADWLVQLAKLVAANMTPQEASERLRAYVPELAARFDSTDFDASSREFVARHCGTYFPSYGTICGLLDKWPKPSSRPALPAPDDGSLDAMDRSWIAFWHKRRAEIYAQQDGFKWGSRERDLANVESLIRYHSDKAWAAISGKVETVRQAPTEREIAAVAAKLSAVVGVPKSQPFDEPAPPPFRDVTMSGDELRRSRQARGLVVPDEVDA